MKPFEKKFLCTKKQSEIALGNIVGSNIFNILFVLGASSVISPLAVNNKVFLDVILMLVFTIVLISEIIKSGGGGGPPPPPLSEVVRTVTIERKITIMTGIIVQIISSVLFPSS
ncbi:hypothetical protein [Domibacillus antri]|uniref:hypothetical protein n=1 Tax=Domibacillus antri TaxID=1714264 RepID=UPI003CCC300F